MKQNYSFLQRVSAIAASFPFINPFWKSLRLLPLLCLLAFSVNAWGDNLYVVSSKCNVPLKSGMNSPKYQLFKYDGISSSVISNITSSLTSTGSIYYNSLSLADTDITDLKNYSTGSSANRTMQGLKISSGSTLTLTIEQATVKKIVMVAMCNSTSVATLTISYGATDETISTKSKDMFVKTYTKEDGFTTFSAKATTKEYLVFFYLYEQYEKTATVTYDPNGGTCDRTSDTYTGEALILPTPNRGGYKFLGWYDADNNLVTSPYDDPAKDVILTAQWTPVEYNITYEGVEGATNNNPITYTIETPTINFAPLSKDGFIFKGWDPAQIEQGSIGDKTITASWEAISTAGYCISVYNTTNANDSKKHYFVQKEEGKSEYIITNFTVPEFNGTPNYWVGENDNWAGYSVNANFAEMPLTTKPESLRLGAATGAVGTLHIWDDNKVSGSNLWIKFTPDGYGLAWGTGSWNEDDYLPFTSTDGVTYTTDMVTLTQEQLDSWEYYVGYKTAGKAVAFSSTNSNTIRVNTMGVYDAAKTEWWNGNIGGFFTAGQHGRFRMWADNTGKNFNCHFMPYYTIVYKANYPEGITGAPDDTYGEYVGLEEEKTLKLAAAPVAPAGYTFKGWTAAQDGTGDLLNPDDNYDLNNPSSNTTLYAQWEKVYTILYDLDGATGTIPTVTPKVEGETFTLALADGLAKEGFTFAGWTDGEKTYAAGDNYTMPAHDVILTALWEGPCFRMTKNAKTDGIAAEESDITAWFDISGGTGAKVMFHPSGSRTPTTTALPFGNNQDVMTVTLSEGSLFTAGTVLKVILESGGDNRGLSFDGVEITGSRVNKLITLEYTLPAEYQNSKSIELKRAGGSVSIRSLEVNGCGVECLDPIPALSTDNAVLCSAGEVTLTATNYEQNARLELYRAGATEADPATLLKTIESATGENVTFEPIAVDATSSYYLVATAGCERTSEPLTITMEKQPTAVTISGVPAEVYIGETYTFTATLTDGEGTNFQWYRNGNLINGATGVTYEFTPQKEDELQNIEFSCKFIGCGGAEVVSAPATTLVVFRSCYYITRDETLGATIGYDFGDFVLYTDGNNDSNYKTSPDQICPPATRRYYTTGVTIYLKNNGAGALRLQGKKENDVNIDKVEIADVLDGTYLPLVDYTAVNYTGTDCGELGIEDVQIPQGKYVHITFTGGEKNEFRISGLCVEGLKCRMPVLAYSQPELTCGINETPELPTLTNDANLQVVYSSSDKDVATVDAATGNVTIIGLGTTTISAIFDGDETYCAATASYQLNVICGDDVPQIAPSVSDIGCEAIELQLFCSDGTTPVTTGTVQWYCDGVAIDGATGYTYTATTAGEYTATLEQNCPVPTSNKAVLTSIINAPIAKAVAPFRTHQIANRKVGDVAVRPYSETTHYPLFTLQPTGTAAQDKEYAFSYIVRNGLDNIKSVTSELLTDTDLKWIREDARDEDGTIHIGANYLELGEWIKSYNESHTDNPFVVGDTIWLTVHPANACSEFDDAVTATIPIKLTDKFSIAYIITGTVDGGFYDVNKGDLGAFYEEFRKSYYEITPVNAYAPYDYSNYEPYDLVILTDYPKATGTKSQPNKVNALADLVDRKPILSFKAHMAADGLDKWKEIGFLASPEVPDEVQKSIQLLCSNHPIFSEDNVGQVEILSQGDSKKGLQGFSELGMDGFVNIATIDGGTKGTLVACCERQKVVEARLVVLSIYSGATQNITEKGMQAVDNVLKYLLQTDETTLSDCSVIFNGEQDNQWTTAGNWEGGAVPTRLQNVRIEADCEVSGGELQVISNVNIKNGCHLTIKPDGALGSLGKFSVYSDENKTYSDITDPKYITIKAEQTGTGALLHTHHLRPLVATVELYSKAYVEMVDGKKQPHWSYIGIPVQEAPIPQFFRGAYTWGYDETNQNIWTRFNDGTTMQAFQGYGLSQSAPQLFTLTGQLVKAEDKIIELTKTAGAGEGQNLIGNSWTAPIQITLLEENDFGEGLNQTVYIYNTGRDGADGVAGGDADNNTPGQWRTIPIGLAKQDGYTGPKTIPAMQAFEVDFLPDATQTTANLTLEYNRVVRTSKGTDLNMPLYAPRPKAQAPADEPELMRICVEDSRTRTELYLLQDERFTNEYDNGWDGFYKEGDGRSAGLWTYTPIGDMAVSAQPAIDGTTLGFVPGRENVYTFSFKWTGQTLYLNDMLLQRSTLIQTGNTYTFTAFEGEQKNRFVISSVPCQEVITSLEQLVLTGDLLTLNNPTGETFDVMVYDPAGRFCIRQQTADNMVQLNLPQNQGVYMVCVGSTNGNKVYKVVR